MSELDFIALACSIWYVSFCITKLSGPAGIFKAIRHKLPLGGLTTCIYCLSIWVGIAGYYLLYNGINEPVYCLGAVGFSHMAASFSGVYYGNED